MRKFVVVLLSVAVFLTASADPFFSLDKADHFMTALVMTVACSMAVQNVTNEGLSDAAKIAAAAALPVLLSFAKEAYDGMSGEGTVSYKDLIYDFAGIITGILIVR